MRLFLTLAALLFASGCGPPGTTAKIVTDRDGDGLEGDEDCDDNDAGMGGPSTWYYDADLDGHGDEAQSDSFCERPEGYSDVGDDCDDTNATVYPGAEDVCDGLDNNCDGVVDDGAVASTFYTDADGDGYGDDTLPVLACEAVEGTSAAGGDCNDADAAYNPGASEEDCEDPNDYNCDGSVGYADVDGDGFAACAECDDGSAAVNPGAVEVCNDADDDCDTLVDDEDDSLDLSSAGTWYADADLDGYGDAATPAQMCDPGPGWVADASDCDDARADVSPAALEACNGYDDDCDGLVDDADDSLDTSTGTAWYTDGDGDGYGDAATGAVSCDAPGGTVADATDCDDTDAFVSPAALESCNGLDDNCDGSVDDGTPDDAATWYADTDGDSYGDLAASTVSCAAPAGSVADATDCDDGNASVNPGATEVCNGTDDDCDSLVDDADASLDTSTATTWYADDDEDGYGDASVSSLSCTAPADTVADATDCDDTNAAINPVAAEICDHVDDDCDGTADNGLATDTWYDDADGDGWGGAANVDCAQPSGTVENDYDCDDTNAAVIPGGHTDCAWDSCLGLLDDGIASTDGNYWIDFAGTATETECDMTTDGGGWTLVFSDHFESAADPGWSTTTITTCGAWGSILGGYGVMAGGTMDVDASTQSITHTEAWVTLDYAAIDSWDGETAWVALDGTTLWSTSLDNHSGAYSEVCGWDRGYYGSYESKWPFDETVAHTAASVNVLAGSTLDQAATDESFGLDNVDVWVR